jgi:phage terminase large subunit-like protein
MRHPCGASHFVGAAYYFEAVPMNDIIRFIDQNVRLRENGEPWGLARHQRAVLAVMYKRDYTTRLWAEIKKSGKTYLAGCVLVYEAITHAGCECLAVANDLEQATNRVFQTAAQLCEKNPALRASVVKATANEIRFSNQSIIRSIASDYRGAAGGRWRVASLDELWGFNLENMTRLYEELRPPPTEKGSYLFITSTAGFSGESTVLEKLYERAIRGKHVSQYEVYVAGGLCAFWSHTGRMPWHTKAYFAQEEADLRPNQFRRLHRNEWVSAESQFISPEAWDSIVDPNHSPILNGATVHVAIDLGVKSDTSAVVAVGFDPSGRKLMTAFHKIWRPTKGQNVNLDDVKAYIKEIHRRHRVLSISADPSQAYLLIQQLAQERISVKEFTQTQSSGIKMGETLFSLVRDGNLIAYKSPELREHILNAVGIETGSGVRMVKGKSSRKIDAAIALGMALVSAVEAGPKVFDPRAVPTAVGTGTLGNEQAKVFGSTFSQSFDRVTEEENPRLGQREKLFEEMSGVAQIGLLFGSYK